MIILNLRMEIPCITYGRIGLGGWRIIWVIGVSECGDGFARDRIRPGVTDRCSHARLIHAPRVDIQGGYIDDRRGLLKYCRHRVASRLPSLISRDTPIEDQSIRGRSSPISSKSPRSSSPLVRIGLPAPDLTEYVSPGLFGIPSPTTREDARDGRNERWR